jgi:hypothetical protein
MLAAISELSAVSTKLFDQSNSTAGPERIVDFFPPRSWSSFPQPLPSVTPLYSIA